MSRTGIDLVNLALDLGELVGSRTAASVEAQRVREFFVGYMAAHNDSAWGQPVKLGELARERYEEAFRLLGRA